MPDLQIKTVDEALNFIKEVRLPIVPNAIGGSLHSANQFWSKSGLDGLILSSPEHNGQPDEVAREVYHRLAARLIASEAMKYQMNALRRGLWIAVLGAFAVFLGFALSVIFGLVSSELGNFFKLVFLAGYFGTPIALFMHARGALEEAPGHMQALGMDKIKDEALGATQRCFIRAVPPNTPADLADIWRHSWYTFEGRPVSSEIVETDATSLAALELAQSWNGCYQTLITSAAASVLCFPIAPLALFLALRNRPQNPGGLRAMELDRRQAVEGSVLVAAGGIAWSKHQEQARVQQVAEALRDRTPIFHLGASTGILAGRGDSYAPSGGIPFDLSLKDLQNHLLVLGGTGSGKTSGILRPLAHQVAEQPKIGLVVMDGKAALPGELSSLKGMQIIDPAKSRFSLVGELSPSELIDTLADVLRSGNESDPFWSDSAMGLLRRAGVLAQVVGGSWWSLASLGQVVSSEKMLDTLIKNVPAKFESDPLVQDALLYFAEDWRTMDVKPKSSILAVARSWISTITAHPDLLAWARAKPGEDSFDLLSPLQGGRLGFLIPAHRYGRAGAAVTALLKARMYAALKARAERGLSPDETPVVFIIDEAQEVATQEDATMLSIGRSLGIALVGATQTVEGVTDKLGDRAAAKWLAVYGNVIGLAGRSHATDEYMAKRAGSTWKAAVKSVPGISVKDSITSSIFSGSIAVTRKQPTMRQFASASPSPIAPFLERSRQAAEQKRAMSSDPRDHREVDEGLSSSAEPVPLVYAAELPTLLAEPNLALAVTVRARVPRRDVIKLTPKF